MSNIPRLGGIIRQNWYNITGYGREGSVTDNKYNYALAILEQVKEFLSFKAI